MTTQAEKRLAAALRECITEEGSHAMQEGLGRQKRRLLAINGIVTGALEEVFPYGSNRPNTFKQESDVDKLRGALLAMVACPDYRHIKTHELDRARQALRDTQP